MSKWHDVSVDFTVELGYDEDGWTDLTYQKPLPAALLVELAKLPADCDGCELDFDIRSSGYYEPMSMYGGPDHLGWPEEGEDERTVEGVSLYFGRGKKPIPLYKTLADELEGLYQEEINSAELPDTDDYDPPEPDYDRDYSDDHATQSKWFGGMY